ncbi:SPOR domain-containing protein [Gilvimarinus polysaccharolyticus]|uniref:SPOR domain-containing protein n=1 Tax=Gilvimarinus polysaccharolyticus TaxID=863921 RepID=UPI0006736CCC|nr:SPOR domain-containing protein [Gilvimarinus polysaccharolyticus]
MNGGLKQRLIGALVLAGIAVIFLPSFFKQHAQYQVDTNSQIPQRPNITPVVIDKPRATTITPAAPAPETMFLPSNEQPLSESGSAASTSSAEPVAVSPEVQEPEPEVVTSTPVAAPAPAEKPQQATEEALTAGAWVVQVASLRSSESAQTLRKKLQARGYKAYVRSAKTSQGEVSRVFIGPKLDKALALEVKQEVDPVLKVNSMVLPFKP